MRTLKSRGVLTWLIILIAVVNVTFKVFEISGTRVGRIEVFESDFLPMRVRIAVAFLIGAVGLLTGGLKVRLLSIAVLTYAFFEYLIWWLGTYRWIRNAASYGDPPIKYHFFLHDASWLDVLIIIAVVITLVWQINACIKLISMRRRKVI